MTEHVMVVMGTRPEAIKLFPLVNLMKAKPELRTSVCVTAQHRDMLDQVLSFADITPDYDLDLMQSGQTLETLSAKIVLQVGAVLEEAKPDRVIVQGDTTTAMMSALAAFYRRIPVSHVEAGLRSGDIYSPWPEEANRKIVGQLADQHFAPTPRAAAALLREGIPRSQILVTGNTVIDALLTVRNRMSSEPHWSRSGLSAAAAVGNHRAILVTCHRRDNFGEGVQNVAAALLDIAAREDVHILFPVHPNPNVSGVFRSVLADHPRITLLPPLDYLDFVTVLDLVDLILTDSGGVQEEAPALGKPVLVLREKTERPEAVEAGTARLVGTDRKRIVEEVGWLLDDTDHYRSMATAHNPFGDGLASERILGVLLNGQHAADGEYPWPRLHRAADGGADRKPWDEGHWRGYQPFGDLVDHVGLDRHTGT